MENNCNAINGKCDPAYNCLPCNIGKYKDLYEYIDRIR